MEFKLPSVMMSQSPDIIGDSKENCDEDFWCLKNSQPFTAACECCGLFLDCKDNSACSNPLTMAAVEIENGGEINEEATHDNQ